MINSNIYLVRYTYNVTRYFNYLITNSYTIYDNKKSNNKKEKNNTWGSGNVIHPTWLGLLLYKRF